MMKVLLATTLILVRHGETDWNAQRRYQGLQDIPLNENGKVQAMEAGINLASTPISAAYTSHLQRAIETAEIITAGKDLQVSPFPDLHEGSFGILEGQTIDAVRNAYADRIRIFEGLANQEKLKFKITPCAESGFEVVQRVLPRLEEIALRHPDEHVLVVTHGGVIRSLIVYLTDSEWAETRIENGKIVPLRYDQGKFTVQ
jgi:uncharacterized phosphatase